MSEFKKRDTPKLLMTPESKSKKVGNLTLDKKRPSTENGPAVLRNDTEATAELYKKSLLQLVSQASGKATITRESIRLFKKMNQDKYNRYIRLRPVLES